MNKTTHNDTAMPGHATIEANPTAYKDATAAHTVKTSLKIAVIDAGRRAIPFDTRDGRLVRSGWETTFDPKTDTVTVWRDHEKSCLGHTPMPAFPPLSEEQAQRIVRNVRSRALDGELDSKPFVFYDDPQVVDDYLDEVAAAIEHPAWCERKDCWDRDPSHSIEHKRTVASHEWGFESLEHTVTSELQVYSENVTPDVDDEPQMQVSVEASEWGEATLHGTPADFRALGRYLITAADDLEWELDDANVSTPDVYKCRCGYTIADGPVLEDGDPTTDELIAEHEATCDKAVQ